MCSYLWKFSCFLSHCCRRTWRLAFWVLCRLACCSQNTVAKAQQPIVKSHCLHVPLSRKRQCSVSLSPLNLIWHYKHVCVSACTWRHTLEATLGWITSTGIIFIKRVMAPTSSMPVAAVCTTNNRGVPGLFCMLRQFNSYTEQLLKCWVSTQ